jgi:hypothetical protein
MTALLTNVQDDPRLLRKDIEPDWFNDLKQFTKVLKILKSENRVMKVRSTV